MEYLTHAETHSFASTSSCISNLAMDVEEKSRLMPVWTIFMYASKLVSAATIASFTFFCVSIVIFLNFSPSPISTSSSSSSSIWSTSMSKPQLDVLHATATAAISGNIIVNNTAFERHAEQILTPSISTSTLGKCDLAQGGWVPDIAGSPLYTNETCRYIQYSLQNCLVHGRPDRDYLHWRWKPSGCDLPPFDSTHFLSLMRGKKLALIGDSLARNHLESLLCTLSQVEDPVQYDSNRSNENILHFPSYNFTLRNFWSPFLVDYTLIEEHDLAKLYLDIPDMVWATQLAQFDIIVVSTGYWYNKKSLYHVDNQVVGASPQSGAAELNVTTMEMLSAMRIAWAKMLKHITKEYKGILMMRTVTVDHFQTDGRDMRGSCKRRKPFSVEDDGPLGISGMPWKNREMLKVQVEEFEKAKAYVDDISKLRLLNVTYSAFLRPDGHPGPHTNNHRLPEEPVNNDCLHWCLPGPIDLWNQFLLHSIADNPINIV